MLLSVLILRDECLCMKVIKPLKLGVLTRCFEFDGQFHMGVSILAFVPLGDEPALLSETGMWKFSAEQLGRDTVLEAGMPKARPEFLVTGKAYAPSGEVKPGVAVKACLGDREKTLYIFGDRYWKEGAPTQAQPFTEMSLGWEQSFGGEEYASNPLGKGYGLTGTAGGDIHWLPNIESPEQRVLSVDHTPEPVNFGPIDFLWPQRASLQGSYDDAWLEKYYPGFPPDTDWGIFNTASRDQQFSQALRGDETYLLENMHPELPLIEGHLPGLQARCFATQKTAEGEQFKEIGTHLRTVWFFPHAKRAILVYQGSIQVQEEDAADILHLLLGAEYQGAPRGIEHYKKVLSQRLDKKKAGLYALRDSDLLPPDLNTPDPDMELWKKQVEPEGLQERNLRKRTEQEHESIREKLGAQDLDVEKYGPKPLPPQEKAPALDDLPAYFEKKEAASEEQRKKLEQLKPAEEKKLQLLCEEHDLDHAEMKASMQKAGWAPPQLTAVENVKKLQRMAEEQKAQGRSQEQVDQLLGDADKHQSWIEQELKVVDMYRLSAHQRDKPPSKSAAESKSMRARLATLLKSRESVAKADFLGIDLSGANLQGLDLQGIYLAGANLNDANLGGANLTDAVLAHASLQNTKLDGAVLNGANLGRTNLCGAQVQACKDTDGLILAGADLEKANLSHSALQGVDCNETRFSQARLDHVIANKLTFLEADLAGCSFRAAELNECTFIQADMATVDFSEAWLQSATFLTCKGQGANFQQAHMNNARFVEKCDFKSASFDHALLNEANLRGTDLAACNLQAVEMNGADFSECKLQGANLNQAQARGAMFSKSDLSGASMQVMDLMTAILQWSNICGADLRNANLYQADLTRVLADSETRLEGANTGKMRIHPKRFRQGTS